MNVLTTHHFLERVRLTAVRTNLSHPLPPTQARPRVCRCFYCSLQLYTHNHPQPTIRPSRCRRYEASLVPQPNSHKPLALAYLAINWFQPVDYSYTREQQTATTKWHAPRPRLQNLQHNLLLSQTTIRVHRLEQFRSSNALRAMDSTHGNQRQHAHTPAYNIQHG
jgi:hypothetical protein